MSGSAWTKFFWSDWQSDPALKLCSLAAQGLWMRMLCVAASHDPIGYVAVAGKGLDETSLARLTGCQESEVVSLLGELADHGVFSRDRHGRIYSRRMIRDAKKAATARKNGKDGGNPSLRKQKDNEASDKGEVKPTLKAHKPEAIFQKAANAASAREPDLDDRRRLQIVGARQAVIDAFREAGSLATPDAGKIDVWAANGWPLDLCVAIVRSGMQRRRDIRSLSYFEPEIRDAIASKRRAPPMPAMADPNDPIVDFGGGFTAALSSIQRAIDRGRWREEWGPKLGSPGCRVPPEIAAQLLITRAA